ncbi:hypothetical protein MLD38_035181 [Melastoma candidum]|uniref:Uncharacterized protein n=1 Tax=Melastoma candidum TaxID=119954 RepID=A0ACB9MCY7_9MYRT|nr:hypothetical protein MLD38_035181 [Melastoma candidum]
MTFKGNPFSLTVPEAAFESWLRDSGYLEVLDHRSSSSSSSSALSSATTSPADATLAYSATFFSLSATLFSLFTLNPLSKLTSDDFSRPTPSWTDSFFGSFESYSFPASPSQARLRVHENAKRFARNYATLLILFFSCSLYQMPVALVGVLSSLALWDLFRMGSDKLGLDHRPVFRQLLVRAAQIGTAVLLIWCNVPMALFCALGVSYLVLLLHAALRKLTPSKQPQRRRK